MTQFEEFAASEFALSAPQEPDGRPLRDHLESAWRQTGRKPAALADAVSLPEGCEQLWMDFLELHMSRGTTGFGPARITFNDMMAWQVMRGTALPQWQIDAIKAADSKFLDHIASQRKETPRA